MTTLRGSATCAAPAWTASGAPPGRPGGRRRVGDPEIDEAGAGDLDRGEAGVASQPRRDPGGQFARVLLQRLGGGEGAVRLKVGEVGAVGGGDPRQPRVHAFGGEGGADRFAQFGPEIGHQSA